jgi:thioredoxin-related protein
MQTRNRLIRREFLINSSIAVVAAATLSSPLLIFAQTPQRVLPESKSLAADIAQSLRSGKPLIVLVSLDNCPFCKIARENYLIPLMREQSLQVVQVNMGHVTAIVDAQGKRTTQAELIKSWQIVAAPTILFLGQNGKELAPRLVGGSTSDFYGAYLQERIDQAIRLLRVS